jgi:nucleotide-binding universal stress UspA family protein
LLTAARVVGAQRTVTAFPRIKDKIMSKQSRRPVVVGVGGSASGRAAIQLAATEAGYREAPLIAVTAYETARPLGPPAVRSTAAAPGSTDEQAVAESKLGEQVMAALGEQAAGAELRAVPGLAGRKLVETARAVDAQLIVLASGLSTSILAGMISQYVLRNAPCPVLVVPDPGMD